MQADANDQAVHSSEDCPAIKLIEDFPTYFPRMDIRQDWLSLGHTERHEIDRALLPG
jgi:hypothetical protein